jgi:hypothetical protein
MKTPPQYAANPREIIEYDVRVECFWDSEHDALTGRFLPTTGSDPAAPSVCAEEATGLHHTLLPRGLPGQIYAEPRTQPGRTAALIPA